MLIPNPHQIEGAEEAYKILSKYKLVYFAWEERTRKSLTAILTAEKCDRVKTVTIVTKKKAKDGWQETLTNYKDKKKIYRLTTYHKFKDTCSSDLIIYDESHNYVSGYPKPSTMWKNCKELSKHKLIIFCSATPNAQGSQLLYHQLALSSWSPWKHYKNFYKWFIDYGIENTIYLYQKKVKTYKEVDETAVWQDIDHLFLRKTRAELGFEKEPNDVLHYITLNDGTKEAYNILREDLILNISDDIRDLVADTVSKLRALLHMLEGGVTKMKKNYLVLNNTEKIDYILDTWGDSESLIIMYHYQPEKDKLEKYFKKARVLQATAYSEGVDLSDYSTLVIYSQDWSTAKYVQRRARQASLLRKEDINVNFLLVKNAISDQCYQTVAINKKNFIDSLFRNVKI